MMDGARWLGRICLLILEMMVQWNVFGTVDSHKQQGTLALYMQE